MAIRIETPLTEEKARALKSGDSVLLSGTIYTARDAAHKRIVEAMEAGKPLPFDPENAVVYYVGPTPRSRDRPSALQGQPQATAWMPTPPPSSRAGSAA